MTVAIIVPVLARPANVRPLMASVAAATTGPYRLLFVASSDDAGEIAELEAAGAGFITVDPSRGSWACKINDGARATTETWVFTGADDLAFHPEWFERALRWADESTRVIGTNDICNHRVMTGQHSTHSLFRRDYIEAFGTIDEPGKVMHEGYGHDFCDDEAVMTAKARGVYVHAYDAIVEHMHPLNGKATDDATYRAGRQHSANGKRLFRQRSALWKAPKSPRVITSRVPAPERAVVVTASYGAYDPDIRVPAAQDMPVDYVCFTDSSSLVLPAPWKVIVAEPMFPGNPRLSAKVAKMTPDVGCPDVVWVDGSHEITSASFVREALASRHDGVAAFNHPRRSCIYAEIEALLGAENQNGLYFDRPLAEQGQAYRAEGYPTGAGLLACGVVAWDLREERTRALGKAWLDETAKWSHQDQVEFPVVCRRLGVEPGRFPVEQIDMRLSRGRRYLANRWLRIHPHIIKAAPVGVSVLIPFASDDPHRMAALEFVSARYRARGFEVIVGTCEEPWSKGRAAADAFSRASHDALVIADADCYVDDAWLDKSIAKVTAGAPWAVPHQRIRRLTADVTKRVLTGRLPTSLGASQNVIIGGGLVVCSRDAWTTVGGIDPRFEGWGGEDISFGWALGTMCGKPAHGAGNLLHLWHSQVERRGSEASEELAGRYRRAIGDPDAMRAIIEEASVKA